MRKINLFKLEFELYQPMQAFSNVKRQNWAKVYLSCNYLAEFKIIVQRSLNSNSNNFFEVKITNLNPKKLKFYSFMKS